MNLLNDDNKMPDNIEFIDPCEDEDGLISLSSQIEYIDIYNSLTLDIPDVSTLHQNHEYNIGNHDETPNVSHIIEDSYLLNPNAETFTPQYENHGKEAFSVLKQLRLDNINKIIIGHININSIRNKFEDIKIVLEESIDIIVISETKLDESFPTNQFIIQGFSKPYRYNRNCFGGGILIYIYKARYT